jgi:uncharacterized protein YdaU (DUF1376 family)
LEHGVYTLLLDWYYANERPIPADKAERIARGNPQETQTVLNEFFKITERGWVNGYADRVIAEYNAKASRNRESGKLGGRPSKTQTVSKNNPNITLATSHKPLAINQEKKEQEEKQLAVASHLLVGISEQVAQDFLKIRKAKRAPLTHTALDGIKREATKAGMALEAALAMCCERGWTGFKADWVGAQSSHKPAESLSPAASRKLT